MSEFQKLSAFKREVVEGQRDQEKQHYAAMLKKAQDKADSHQLRAEIGRAVEALRDSAGWPFVEAVIYKRLYDAAESVRKESGDTLVKALASFEILRDVLVEIENLVKEGSDSEDALLRQKEEREKKNE